MVSDTAGTLLDDISGLYDKVSTAVLDLETSSTVSENGAPSREIQLFRFLQLALMSCVQENLGSQVVSDPMSEEETLSGLKNRVLELEASREATKKELEGRIYDLEMENAILLTGVRSLLRGEGSSHSRGGSSSDGYKEIGVIDPAKTGRLLSGVLDTVLGRVADTSTLGRPPLEKNSSSENTSHLECQKLEMLKCRLDTSYQELVEENREVREQYQTLFAAYRKLKEEANPKGHDTFSADKNFQPGEAQSHVWGSTINTVSETTSSSTSTKKNFLTTKEETDSSSDYSPIARRRLSLTVLTGSPEAVKYDYEAKYLEKKYNV